MAIHTVDMGEEEFALWLRVSKHPYLFKLEPNEPFFPLMGRDRETPATIRIWAHLWLQEINLGLRPETDRPQISQALIDAVDCEIYYRDHVETPRALEGLTFDDTGTPTTGPHRRREKNSTSGAQDT
jgi:hypothetical protein